MPLRTTIASSIFIAMLSSLSGPTCQTCVATHPIDNSVSPIRGLIERYQMDRGSLLRVFTISTSPNRETRLRSLIDSYLKSLDGVDFNSLDRDGQIDFLLLRNELRFQRTQLVNNRKQHEEVAYLLPFAKLITTLEEGRRQLLDQEGRDSAKMLATIPEMIERIKRDLATTGDGGTKTPDAIQANRAATIVYEYRRAIDAWFRFYDSYNPEFSWWVKQPVEEARQSLDQYGKYLKSKFAGFDGEDAPIIGDPIGRAALMSALKKELIPYTPEELIAIAEREFEWCEKEMTRAANDLGFDGNWQKTLDQVSELHMRPGEQPKLIKQLAQEAVDFLEARNLVTIPDLCKRTWRMEMMSAERQKVSPYFTGGEVISVSYPTQAMSHAHKMMSMRGNNIHFSRATVQHELIPGHHLQGFMMRRYNSHRSLFRTPFLIEGWALYWEMHLWDLGFPQTAEDRVGMLFWRSHRCARIVFSLKFHLGQMTADEAVNYLVDRVGHERRNATAEVRRSVNGSYEPLYQAAYMLGGLQIKDLRRELVDSKKMTDREFHDAILRENSIPIPFIRASLSGEELTQDWNPTWHFYPHAKSPTTTAATAKRNSPSVYRDRVQPHWFADNTKFWYRIQTGAASHEFALVDSKKGERSLAFDHAKIAQALKDIDINATQSNLPISQIQLDDEGTLKRITLNNGAQFTVDNYRLHPETTLEPNSSKPSFDARGLKSQAGGRETHLTFSNQLKTPISLVWIGIDGVPVSYDTVSPGKSHRQHTFAGHSWIVRDVAGSAICGVTAPKYESLVTIEKGVEGTVLRPKRIRSQRRSRATRESSRSPDGKWGAFVRNHNLWIRNVDTNEETQLTQDGSTTLTYRKDHSRRRAVEMNYGEADGAMSTAEVYWSPDSKKLVAMQTKTSVERMVHLIESSPRDQLQPKLHKYSYFKPGDDIPQSKPHLFDLDTFAEISIDDKLFSNPWSINDIRWASDSGRFTFFFNQRGHQVVRLLAVDASSGLVEPIINEETASFFDYAGKKFLRYLNDSNELIWMSERSGWNHLYLIDSASGEVKNAITKGDWVVRKVDHVDERRQQVWFYAGGVIPGQDPYYSHYCRANFDGTDFTILTQGNGTHTVRFSPNRELLLDTYSRVDMAPVTELRSATTGMLLCEIERADATEIFKAGRSLPAPFVATGRDDTTKIYGIVHRPRDFDPTKRYPVIENVYAGPHSAHVPKAFRARYGHQQEIADRGFIVVQIDGMGTSHRSKAFHDVCWKNLGDAGFPDRIAWIKAAAQEFPQMDIERVGIYGGSAGGQNALRALLAHGDFYDVAVADCGCHDNRMDKVWWNELWMGWPIGKHYEQQSNVTQAHRLTGKLFLTVGELDRNVDPASTMQVVNALIKADKDFDMLVVPGGGHGIGESPYAKRRRIEFFVEHLMQ